MATHKEHAAAVLAVVEAKLSALTIPWHAYDLDDIPATRPDTYVEVMVSRRFIEAGRMTGKQSRTGWRITARAVAKKTGNARTVHKKVTEALEDVRLNVGGVLTSPIQFETEDPVVEDDGWFSGLTSWTYTHGGNPNA